MRKIILTTILFLFIAICFSTVLSAASNNTSLKISSSSDSSAPGDIITYTVSIGKVDNLMGLDFEITIPDGLSYVDGSGVIASNLKESLGYANASWEENHKIFAMYGDGDYSSSSDTIIMVFKCKVTSDTTLYSIYPTFKNACASNTTFEEIPCEFIYDDAKTDILIPVTNITLDKETISLDTVDISAMLVANVHPNNATNKEVIWHSSNESVATVVNGVVTAINHGQAIITVKTVDGNFTDTCIVTVNCAHATKTTHERKTATCQEGGHFPYLTCDNCGQIFDVDGTTKLTTIPTTEINSSNHVSVQSFDASIATCLVQGHDAYKKCTSCNTIVEGSDKMYYSDHNYGEIIEAKDQIHTQTELVESVASHYQCSVCKNYFTAEKIETVYEDLLGTIPSHSYDNLINTDENEHWKECSCGKKDEINSHSYDNDCDTDCNDCGYQRVINHSYSEAWTYDNLNHWKECSCGSKLEVTSHSFDNDCDTDCNDCGYQRVINHSYSEAWTYDNLNHWKECSCGSKAEISSHAYDNDCDTDCNDCGYQRVINHSYSEAWEYDDSNHWKECSCGSIDNKSQHSFGEWITTKEPTTTESGTKEKSCIICSFTVSEDIPVVIEDKNDKNLFLWIAIPSISVFGIGFTIIKIILKKRKLPK